MNDPAILKIVMTALPIPVFISKVVLVSPKHPLLNAVTENS